GPGSGVLSPASGVTELPSHQVAKAGEGMNAQRPSGEAGATLDTRHATLKIGDILRPGDGVEVGADGYAKLAYPDGTQIDLHGSTRLRVGMGEGENKDAKRLALDVGKMGCEAAKQPAGRPMRLATPHAVAEVVGTKYALNVDKDRTGLEVAEGSVRLTRRADNQTLLIGPGQNAEASDKGLRMLPPRAAAEDWLKPLPSNEELAAITLEDGEIIFQDDFTNGLVNWEVLHVNREAKKLEPLADAMKDSVKIVSVKRGDQEIKAVRVDAGNEEVVLALRQPIRERWFAVEFEDHYSDSATTGTWINLGFLSNSGPEKLVPFQYRKRTFSNEEQKTQWWCVRWEFCCGTDPQGCLALDMVRAVGVMEGRGRTRVRLRDGDGIVRPVIETGPFLITHVTIRRLVPKERAVGVP
ncbi:MAG: FecR family protein, partial [bacterium]